MVLFPNGSREANWDSGLDDHDGIRVNFQNQLDDCFNGASVEVVLFTIVVGWSGDDDEVSILVGSCPVSRSYQIQVFFMFSLLSTALG